MSPHGAPTASYTLFHGLRVQRWNWQPLTSDDATINSQTVPPFHYSYRLNGIRLLILHRRLPWSPVSCSLIQVSLDSTPAYEAISYSWGNSNHTCAILVNGCVFQVT
jgi:hypothetical protein